MTEKELRNKAEAILANYFNLYPEVTGYDKFGNRKRIDLIIEFKEDPEFVFGVEFKANQNMKGFDLAQWCKQMRDYSFIEWGKWGIVPIISCPHISMNYLKFIRGYEHPEDHDHNNINSFLSEAFNFGEIRPKRSNNSLRICFANKVIWQEFIPYGSFVDGLSYRKIRQESHIHSENYGKISKNIQTYIKDAV